MREFGRRNRLFDGRGRMPNGDKPGSGPNGNCICPKCGYKTSHGRATPCNQQTCPKCGNRLTRE
jgi:hypothetical protein